MTTGITRRRALLIGTYVGAGFLLHLLWETLQMPLFAEGSLPFWEHFALCLKATATGDMAAMAMIYGTLAIAHRDLWWIAQPKSSAHPATWLLPMIVGILFALTIELRAVYADQRWSYTEAMPLIPSFRVGLTPVLQMVVIPLLVILISHQTLKILSTKH